MTLTQIRARLANENLSLLSRVTGINVRTLRRIKRGTSPVLSSTMDKLSNALKGKVSKP